MASAESAELASPGWTPVPKLDATAACEFLVDRADWLAVGTVDVPGGGWDVVLRLDGIYLGEVVATRQEMIDYFVAWLSGSNR